MARTCLLLALVIFPLPAQTPVGLDRLLESVRANNKDLAAAWKRRDEAVALRSQASLRPAASAGLSAGAGRLTANPGESEVAPEFALPVELGGKRAKRIAVAEAEISLAGAAADERLRRIIFEVKLRYADAAAEQLRLGVTERLLEVLARDLALTRERVAQGDASLLARKLLEVEAARLNASLDLRRGRAAAALFDLGQLAGWPAAEPLPLAVELARPLNPPPADELTTRSLALRPDLRALRAEGERARREQELARADGYPTLTTSVRYSWQRQALGPDPPLVDRGQMLLFGVSVPLTTPKRTLGLQNAAAARADAARLQAEQLELSIRGRINGALRKVQSAKAALEVFDSQVLSKARENLNVVREAYQLGELRIQDVLMEQRRYLDMELDRIQALYEAFVALAELELEVGGPLS